LATIAPKSGSVQGGGDVVINIDLDETTASSIQNLTVGFQPRQKKHKGGENGNASRQNSIEGGQASSKKGSRTDQQAGFDEYVKVPKTGDGELKNWTCSPGVYENGKITCKVPKLEPGSYDPEATL